MVTVYELPTRYRQWSGIWRQKHSTMKENVNISIKGGSYYDTETDDTIYFSVKDGSGSIVGMPEGGKSVLVKTWDSMGDRDEVIGNTHYKHNGFTMIKRPNPLTIIELIKELL